MKAIGIDIGGMSIKIGLCEDGKIIAKRKVITTKDFSEAVNNICDAIVSIFTEQGITEKEIAGIGIGCPGTITSSIGKIDFLPNIGWKDVFIADSIKKRIDTKIVVSNDANVAALGENIYGSAKEYNSSVMLTLGTGVGGGIIIDRKLYEGGQSKGAELGHVTLISGGEQCGCGRKGCIEAYASATALMRQTKEEMLKNKNSLMWQQVGGDITKVDGKLAFDCEALGDTSAKTVVDNYVMYLSESIMNMCNIFRPEAIVLGGGVSAQGDNLIKRIKAYCEKYSYGYQGAPVPEILCATLGNDAGIIGASALLIE